MFRIAATIALALMLGRSAWAQNAPKVSESAAGQDTSAPQAVSEADTREQALAQAIEREVGQPPQMVLDYVRQHPYTRQALIAAAARTGVDVDLLAAIFFAEFHVPFLQQGALIDNGIEDIEPHEVTADWNLLDGVAFKIDSFYLIGIDAFAEEAPQLKRRGLLPPDFRFEVEKRETKNEMGMSLRRVYFNNLGDTIAALAAVVRGRQDRALAQLQKLGVSAPSFAERAAATYLFYNAANPARLLSRGLAAPKAQGSAARLGFLAPSWRRRHESRSAYQHAGRVLATALFFQRSGVFAPEPAATGSAVPQPGAERPEAQGMIEKLKQVGE